MARWRETRTLSSDRSGFDSWLWVAVGSATALHLSCHHRAGHCDLWPGSTGASDGCPHLPTLTPSPFQSVLCTSVARSFQTDCVTFQWLPIALMIKTKSFVALQGLLWSALCFPFQLRFLLCQLLISGWSPLWPFLHTLRASRMSHRSAFAPGVPSVWHTYPRTPSCWLSYVFFFFRLQLSHHLLREDFPWHLCLITFPFSLFSEHYNLSFVLCFVVFYD